MNQSCVNFVFCWLASTALQEVISPSRVKAVTHNSKTAVHSPYSMSLFVPECLEELQEAGSHPHRDDLCLTHLSTVKRVSIQKKRRRRRREKKNALNIHMFCISACMGEDDISFLSPSHLKRANSICTPSCF